MSKKKDLTPTRKVTLTLREPALSDQMGDVFKVSAIEPAHLDEKNMVQPGSIGEPGT